MAKSSRSRSSKSARPKGGRPARPEGGAQPEDAAQPESGAQPEGGAQTRAIDKARAANKARGTKPLKGAAARRKVEQRRRRQTILYSALTVAVVGILVTVIVLDRQQEDSTDEDFQASQSELASAREAAGCTDVTEHPEASRTHLSEGDVSASDWDPADFDWNSNPPSSGEHLPPPYWVRPGFYDEDQDERQVIHSLEHGYVAVQYKGISDDQIEQLRELQNGYDGQKLVVQPYEGLDADGVALSAWTYTQTCEQVNTDVIEGFIDGFMLPTGSQSVAPEPQAG